MPMYDKILPIWEDDPVLNKRLPEFEQFEITSDTVFMLDWDRAFVQESWSLPDIIRYHVFYGGITHVTSSITQLSGYSPQEMTGRPIADLFHKEDMIYFRQRPESILMEADEGMFCCRLRHRNGNDVWTETLLKIIRDRQGRPVGLQGTIRDISKRKKDQDALISAKRQLEMFIDRHSDAIITFDAALRVIRCNRAFELIYGWSKQEWLYKKAYELGLIPESSKDEFNQQVQRVCAGLSVNGKEMIHQTKTGELITVICGMMPIHNVNGEFQGFYFTARDITEQKKTESFLIRNEKLAVAGQLAAGVAHEIRNPLTALKGFVQLLMQQGANPTYLEVMENELSRIEMIVGELLMLAKPQVFQKKRYDLMKLIRQVVTLLEVQAQLHNIEMNFIHKDAPIYLECEETQLKQVLVNVIKNAFEAMPEGGRLDIDVQVSTSNARITVRDNGIGLSKEQLERVGEPFFTTKELGTGLGLMMCKRIMEQHEGRLEMESELGKGTSVHLYLPILPQDQQT